MVNLEKIRLQIINGTPIERVLSRFDWSGFESAVAEIFLENGFDVERNIRFKNKRRYEIDIVASRSGKTICVDCKGWREGRNKKSALMRAAEDQKERAKEFKPDKKCIPMIVTLLDENVKIVKSVLIIPVWKLNAFLNSADF